MAEALGAAYPLLGVFVLAASGLALMQVHWTLVVHWDSGWLTRITPREWPNQVVWGVAWLGVIPCVLLPIFGSSSFFGAELAWFAVAKLYTLVLFCWVALLYKLAWRDGALPQRTLETALSLVFMLLVLADTLWQIIQVGQHWWDIVNTCSGALLSVAVVVSTIKWGAGVRVYASNFGDWETSTTPSGKKDTATPLRVKSYSDERHFHLWLTPLFVLAYSVQSAAFLAASAPQNAVFLSVVSLLMPAVVVFVWPRESWVEVRLHALLGATLLVEFPGVQVAALLQSTAPWAGSEAARAALSVVGLACTLACCADLMRANAQPWHWDRPADAKTAA